MEGQIKETPFTVKQFEEYVEHKKKSEKLPNLSELSKEINTKPVLLRPLKKINHFNELPKLSDLSGFTEVNKLDQCKHTEYSWNKEETVKKPVPPKSLKEKNDSEKQCKKQHKFTKEEDDRIIELYKKYPNQWINIARELGTRRNSVSIQKHYKLLINKNNTKFKKTNEIKEKASQHIKTCNALQQQDLLNSLNKTMKKLEEELLFNNGFLHDYDYKAMGYSIPF